MDNERLDSNGTFWGDADAARFMKRVLERLPGFPASRLWHYASASDYRAVGSWPQLAALGIRFWWAAYGNYPTGQTPDHEPSLQGSIPRWDVHQYSSLVAVAGFSLDGNYSPISTAELFGGTTTTKGADDMPGILMRGTDLTKRPWRLIDIGYDRVVPDLHVGAMKLAAGKVLDTINDAQYDQIKANFTQGVLGAVGGVNVDTVTPAELQAAVETALAGATLDVSAEQVAAIAKASVDELARRATPAAG